MSNQNGTSAPLGPFRSYFCSDCGVWLFETNVPLGTPGQIRTKCRDRTCAENQAMYAGDPPAPKADRAAWLARRRPRAVSLDRLAQP